jgi:hypothetical protein
MVAGNVMDASDSKIRSGAGSVPVMACVPDRQSGRIGAAMGDHADI